MLKKEKVEKVIYELLKNAKGVLTVQTMRYA